jgi:hypothetical protein
MEDFLRDSKEFGTDLSREKFLLTFNPGGYLKRIASPAGSERESEPELSSRKS